MEKEKMKEANRIYTSKKLLNSKYIIIIIII
jgi:hypothetical protein